MLSTRRLSQVELRVVGTLMEKEKTTPDAYPMTLKALRAACNQKTNRDPVTDLSESEVLDTLEDLRKDVLVWRSSGARAERWEQRVVSRWELGVEATAVITLLILRGPQTPGELRTRSDRMASFDSVERVVECLRDLSEGEHPFVTELPRAPGQRETRWRHLLGRDEPSSVDAATLAPSSDLEKRDANSIHRPTTPSLGEVDRDQRMTELESKVEDLERRLAALEDALT